MLTKNVNGKDVPMSAEEEAATLAEWAANDPSKLPPVVPQPTVQELQDQIDALQSALASKGIVSLGTP